MQITDPNYNCFLNTANENQVKINANIVNMFSFFNARNIKKTKDLLTFQKDKLNVYTFNLPRLITCPGKTFWCKEHCYANKGQFRYSNVLKAHIENMVFSLSNHFVKEMSDYINARTGHNIIRIHSCGDFYNLDYMNKWAKIAYNTMGKATIFAYTRTWIIPGNLELIRAYNNLNNLKLWCSIDNSNYNASKLMLCEIDHKSYIEDVPNIKHKQRSLCKAQLTHKQIRCSDCKKCFNKDSKQVVFMIH